MLSEQEQESVVRPFQVLVSKFESELEIAREALTEWAGGQSISMPGTEAPKKDELDEKIRQLEKGKHEVEEFILTLTPKFALPDVEFKEMVDGLEADRARYALIFNEANALYNFKYTVVQKNEINRRINAINSSRLLNNADMGGLQKQWTALLGMKNDKELRASKKIFEDRLLEWESLIAKKNRGGH